MNNKIHKISVEQRYKTTLLENNKNKNICIVSGGGNRGACAVGYLNKNKQDFDIVIGTSTGALMCIHVAMGWYEELKEQYINIKQDDILNKSKLFGRLFNKKGKIRLLFLIQRILRKKISFADSFVLRKTIKKSLTKEKYNEFKNSGKQAIVGVYNLTDLKVEYKSSNDYDYEDFVDWMWLSANQPPVMSIIEKNGKKYVDGGVSDVIGIEYCENIVRKEDNILAIELRPETIKSRKKRLKNFVDLFSILIDAQRKEIIRQDSEPKKHIIEKGAKLKHVFLPYGYEDNDLIFNKEKMTELYNLGFSHE